MDSLRISVIYNERNYGPMCKTHNWTLSMIVEETVVYQGWYYTEDAAWERVSEVIRHVISHQRHSESKS